MQPYFDPTRKTTSVQTSDITTRNPEMGPKRKDNFRNKSEKCQYYNRGYCKNGEAWPESHYECCPGLSTSQQKVRIWMNWDELG